MLSLVCAATTCMPTVWCVQLQLACPQFGVCVSVSVGVGVGVGVGGWVGVCVCRCVCVCVCVCVFTCVNLSVSSPVVLAIVTVLH